MRLKGLTAGKLPVLIALTTCAGAVLLTSATKNPFTVHDKAYYATKEKDVSFVRPGLVVTIQNAAIAQDGTVTTRVKFTDLRGLPLDKDGITTPGAISAGAPGMIIAAFNREKNEFTSYTTRTQTSTITRESAIQAGADSGGTWTKVAEGEYTYAFRTKAPNGWDRNAVHAVGVYANRNLNDLEAGIQLDDDVFYFTPSDSKQTTNPKDEMRTATCHKCHGPNMAFHGETGRTSMQMCDLCHTSQTIDPDTRNTMDMKVLIHKVHMGENLPSVKAGQKYQVIGFGGAVADYSHVLFPAPNMKCEACHEDRQGVQHSKMWLENPSRAACGSCHDDVNFATGENHVNLPVFSDAECKRCHIPQGESDFDASILGAHVVPQESRLLTGLKWEIVKVDDGVAGKKPTVTFSIKDKNGNGLPMTAMNRVALTLAGPTLDYTLGARGYIQEDAIRATGSNGVYTYTFNAAIPADAKGTYAIGLEGRRVEVVLQGTTRQRSIQYGATNPVTYFSVDGSAVKNRDEITPNQNCLQCHYRLALHGENRVNNAQYCVMCHNPKETDASRRPAAAAPAETIDMKFMIHRIHGGEELHNFFGTDYTVYGFGGTPIGFNEVLYPGKLNECFQCHANGTENPSAASAVRSAVNTPRYPVNPMPSTTTACYGCHATNTALVHAQANTTQLGESCTVCHSATAEFSATKAHASEIQVNREQANK